MRPGLALEFTPEGAWSVESWRATDCSPLQDVGLARAVLLFAANMVMHAVRPRVAPAGIQPAVDMWIEFLRADTYMPALKNAKRATSARDPVVAAHVAGAEAMRRQIVLAMRRAELELGESDYTRGMNAGLKLAQEIVSEVPAVAPTAEVPVFQGVALGATVGDRTRNRGV